MSTDPHTRSSSRFIALLEEFTVRLQKVHQLTDIARETLDILEQSPYFSEGTFYTLDEDREFLIPQYGLQFSRRPILVDAKTDFGRQVLEGRSSWSGKEESGKSKVWIPLLTQAQSTGMLEIYWHTGQAQEDSKRFALLVARDAAQTIALLKMQSQQEKQAHKTRKTTIRLDTFIGGVPGAIIVLDAGGKIREWNPGATGLFGPAKEEVLGQKMVDLIIHPPFRRIMEMGLQTIHPSADGHLPVKTIEIQAIQKNNVVAPVEFTIFSPGLAHEPLEYFLFVRDLTHEQNVHQELHRALERERELSDMKSRLVSITSHEFRTPLTTIQTNIELLSFYLDREKLTHRDKMSRNLERIDSELNRLNTLMSDVLLAGQIEAGKIPQDPAYTDLSQLCKDIISQRFHHTDDGRTIEFKEEGTPRPVFIDPDIYTHILTNLMSNALKYSPDSSNPRLHLRYTAQNARIRIQDDGIGIPEKDLSHIFDSFFRSDNAENIQGTGLGLAIVKEFCTMQGAEIEVESRLCWGSKFTVFQPYTPKKSPPGVQDQSSEKISHTVKSKP